ncbi:LysR substrate-binding domain-containing protein [Leeia oryzae]|uniref:LysR substrate-binding domain-containing protein n=1 Tax=Leeia oryzae TaxID=356662 RepID=UPI00035FDB26|nr:LysR substrate-binding domain-containing protein [Leeia oryzae]
MELRHLRYFVAVAEELHFSRAAEKLHIGQPPLSQQIQALEQEIGTPLFERSKRHVALTPAGKHFLAQARQILANAESASQEARRIGLGEAGELRIGFTSSLPFSNLLPRVIHAYRQQFADVRLTLREMFTLDQYQALQQDKLDVGFVRFTGLDAPTGISLKEIGRDQLRLVVHDSHPLARQASIRMADLQDEPFICYPPGTGSGLRNLIRRLCLQAGFEPRITQEAREATTQIGLVAAGVGVSLLPSPLSCVQIPHVCYIPIDNPDAYLAMGLATWEKSSAAHLQHFLAEIEAQVENEK